MIDPKINLRISADTDLELLRLGRELTRLGLGFPQYSNDDVVIPGLVAHGYELEDARDYTVAACWEFIIPGKGMEVVNIGAVSMPAAVDTRHPRWLGRAARISTGILTRVRGEYPHAMSRRGGCLCEAVAAAGALLLGADGRLPGTRARSFARPELQQFRHPRRLRRQCRRRAGGGENRSFLAKAGLQPEALIRALDSDWADAEALRLPLREQAPKVGNNDDEADALLVQLFDFFADACAEVRDNGRGGIIRAGSGSAMYYVWLARGHAGMREPLVGATADGRQAGEFFSANLAPSPGTLMRGPLSVLQSFRKIDYRAHLQRRSHHHGTLRQRLPRRGGH